MSTKADEILAKYGVSRSGSTNPVIQRANGELAQKRASAQQEIIDKAKADDILAKYGVSRSGVTTTAAQSSTKTTAPNPLERVAKTVTGGAKSSAAGFTGALGTTQAVTGGVARSNYLQRDIEQWQKELERYRYQAKNAADEADKLYYLMEAGKTQNNIERAQQELSKTATAGQNTMETAARLSEDADKDIARAKEGAGKAGSFLVDLGAAGTQMAGDALTGGLGAMAVRSFGSGALEARQSGASLGQQVGYGLGSAAVGTLTEKIANVAGPFKKVFGSGLLDKALSKVAAKPAGKLAISVLSEGFEEGAEALAQPLLQRLTYNPEAAYDADWLADTLYSMAIGAAMGGIGGAVDVAWNGRGAQNAVRNGAGTESAQNEGKVTTAEQAGAQGAVGDIMTQEAQRLYGQNKTAPNVGAGNTRMQETDLQDYLRVGVRQHVRDLKQEMVRNGDSPILTTPEKVTAFIKDAIVGRVRNTIKAYGKVGQRFQRDVAAKSGGNTDITGYYLELDANRMQHLSDHINDDGDPRNIPLTEEQVLSIPDYIDSYDDVLKVITHKDGQTRIHLGKQINGHSVVVVLASKGRSSVQPVTAWQNTTEHYREKYAKEKTPVDTSRNPAASGGNESGYKPASSGTTVTQQGDSVNVENMDPLLQMMMGGKRVDQSKATNEQFAALAERGDVGVDAAGKLFQIDPAQHIDSRTMESVGSRTVKAFQFDHPQLHSYFQRAANALIADADLSMQFGLTRSHERGMQGNKVNQKAQTSAHLRRAMDETGLSRSAIIDAAQRIVNDKGQENVKAAKQVEIILDDMLTNGWQPMAGEAVAPNEAYIKAKGEIAGSQAAESGHGLDGIGAADAGFTTLGTEGEETTSRMANNNPYNSQQEAATGMTKEEYDRLFRYESQTEERSMRLAEELLYMVKDGKRTFLKDIDEASYAELIRSLNEAAAWNGPQMDAAHMIQMELQGRSVNMEIESEEYVDWLRIMREHETATGQGVQANAKWSRTDNPGGSATEMEAWENLGQSNLSNEEKVETFRRIVQWDMEIEAATDVVRLKDIILQVAEQRGVIGGPFGAAFRKVADSTLDSLTLEQLKQFAYASTSALSKDHIPANWGQKLKTIQVLNMLSSPKTATKNLVGNTSFYGIDALAMDGAAILDMALSHVTGTRSVAMERSALGKATRKDAVKAMRMAIAEITLDVDMSSAESRYGTGSRRTFKASGNLAERALSAIERNQAYLLTATDEFYKGAARGTAANTQKLVDEGRVNTTDKEYAQKQADRLAKYRTFQDDSTVSVMIQQIHDLLNLVGIGESGKTIKGKTVHAFGAGDIAAPFTRVAGNLVSRGLDYSPVNAVKGLLEIAQQVVKHAGGQSIDPTTQAKAVSDAARGMTGTAIAYGFMLLAKEGMLRRADDEEDPDAAAMNQSEGMSGTQLNITAAKRALEGGGTEWQTGDTLVDLSSIEPLNFLVNLGAELAKEDSNPLVSTFNATTNSAMSAATELPVLESVGNFSEDVFKYGADPKESLAQEAANTLISSVVPNVVAGVAKGLDDRPRNAYAGDDLWDIIQASFKNRIPGLRETLPGSVNVIGEEKLYQGSEDALLAALLSPVNVNTYSQSDISKEMSRVREESGVSSFYPSKSIPKELSYTDEDGEKHITALDYEQRQDFQRDRGTTTMLTVTNMMGSSYYKQADSVTQAELLDRCRDYAYQLAEANVMGEDVAEAWVINAKNARKELGISTTEYLNLYHQYGGDYLSGTAYEGLKDAVSNGLTAKEYLKYRYAVKGLTADKDKSGASIDGSKKAKVLEAINSMDISDASKDWLYYLEGYSEKTISEAPWH